MKFATVCRKCYRLYLALRPRPLCVMAETILLGVAVDVVGLVKGAAQEASERIRAARNLGGLAGEQSLLQNFRNMYYSSVQLHPPLSVYLTVR